MAALAWSAAGCRSAAPRSASASARSTLLAAAGRARSSTESRSVCETPAAVGPGPARDADTVARVVSPPSTRRRLTYRGKHIPTACSTRAQLGRRCAPTQHDGASIRVNSRAKADGVACERSRTSRFWKCSGQDSQLRCQATCTSNRIGSNCIVVVRPCRCATRTLDGYR